MNDFAVTMGNRRRPMGVIVVLFCALLATACQSGSQAPARGGGTALPGFPGVSRSAPPGSLLDDEAVAAVWSKGQSWQPNPDLLPTDQAGERPENIRLLEARPSLSQAEGFEGGPRARLNFFAAQRAYPKDSLPNGGFVKALQQTLAMMPIQAAETLPQWQSIGPAPMKNSKMGQQAVDVSGRVTALAVDPRNSQVVYLGAAQGGVWKTTNGGDSWTPLTDDQASLSIGSIALDPSHPDTVYVGTGEPTPGLDNYYGAGILKSTDGGKTWTRLGADVFNGLAVAKIVVDPTHSNLVYAASSQSGTPGVVTPLRGVWKSSDGGQSWTAIMTCQDCFGASDLVMDAGDPTTLYAGFWGYGVFKIVNGQWNQLSGGLPNPQQVQVGRVMLGISRSNPKIVYASYQVTIPQQYAGALVFKSTDGGASWTQMQTGGYNFCGSQCWYSHVIAVHPTSPDTVLLGGMAAYTGQTDADFKIQRVVVRTTDSGQTWDDLTPNTSSDTSLHPDMHAIAFDPQQPNTIWVGNDGGVWKTTDGGQTWQDKNTNLATLQFTGIAVDPQNEHIVQGGMQDNNKAFTTQAGGNSRAWTAMDVGDGGWAAIDPFRSNTWYGSRFGKSFQRIDDGSQHSGQWPMKVSGIDQRDQALFYMPFVADPSTQGVLYVGTNRVYRTTDRGDTWTAVSGDLSKGRGSVSTLAVAPSDAKTLYAGTSDGNIHVSTNSGGSWTDITKAPLPNRYVSRIVVSSANPQVAYAVFNGFNTHTPGENGHVFKTGNRGGTWQDISGNLPDVPVQSIVLDKHRPGVIYIGTDTGVFRSTNDGQSWLPFNNGLPHVAVVDLAMNSAGTTLFAATHGRSVFQVSLVEGQPPTVTPTATPTRPANTPTATPPIPSAQQVYLPNVRGHGNGGPVPTATPTAIATATPTITPSPTATPTSTATPTATPVPTNTATPTFTPVTPEGTQLPTNTPTPTFTPTETPTVTPTPTVTNTPLPPGTPSPTPTDTPTVTPTPTNTPRPRTNTYSDDFSDANSGWFSGSDTTCAFDYTTTGSGEPIYAIDVAQAGQFCIAGAPSVSKQVDGSYQMTAFKNGAADGSVYGLVFGLDDPNNIGSNSQFYVFWVNPYPDPSIGGASFALQKFDQGAWTDLTGDASSPWVASTAILSDDSANVLKVRRQGGEILLFVNGVYLAVVNDDSFPGNGYVGMANWAFYDAATAVAGFDDFTVNQSRIVYQDDYAQERSGWFQGTADSVCQASYSSGEYRTAVQPNWLCYYGAPTSPQFNGRFQVTVRREDTFYETAYGIFFAGSLDTNSSLTTFYAFLVIPDSQSYALAKYDGSQWWGITWDDTNQTAWLNSDKIHPSTATNKLTVERDGTLLQLWINDAFLGSYVDPSPLSGGYFGVLNWPSQYDTAIVDFDDYSVTAWEDTPGAKKLRSAAMRMPKSLAISGTLQKLPSR